MVGVEFIFKLLYDKRVSLPIFFVISYSTSVGGTPMIARLTFAGGATMIARSTLRFSDFLPKVCELFSRILRQRGKVRQCHSFLKKL